MSKKPHLLSNNKDTIKRVFKSARPYSFLIVLSLIISIIDVAAQLFVPVLCGYAIDGMIDAKAVDFSLITDTVLYIGILTLLSSLCQWFISLCNNKITYNMSKDLRDEAIAKIQTLPLSYIDKHPIGDIVSRVISDVDTFSDGLLLGLMQFFTGVLKILGTLAIMLFLNPIIAIVVFCLTPLSMFSASFISKKTYKYFVNQNVIRAEQTAYINENIDGVKVVKSFGMEEKTIDTFNEQNERLRKTSLKATYFSSLPNPTTRFVNSLVYIGVILVGAIFTISGTCTIGSLSVFLNYADKYTKPFNDIASVLTELQSSIAAAAHIYELLDQKSESEDSENELNNNGIVKMDDVSFTYPGKEKTIQHFSLCIRQGQKVAIVGPTGSGKTTIINLLMRFYDIDSGTIEISDTNTQSVSRTSLRKSIGMVLQDTWLKAGSVKDNIAYGKPDASLDEIINAAKLANAHSFIRRLPNGYDTIITESGSNLSEGQKQLICIARIMLALPPMLILDEATSNIDTRTEINIQEAFSKIMEGRTSIIVAHRLSTIKNSDLIVVMKAGEIVETGTHNELLKLHGSYYDIYNSQYIDSHTLDTVKENNNG